MPESTHGGQSRATIRVGLYSLDSFLCHQSAGAAMPSVSLADARAPLLVALDAGTSSVRALAFDSRGRPILACEEQLPYTLETPSDGGATFPADSLFDFTIRAIDGVVA